MRQLIIAVAMLLSVATPTLAATIRVPDDHAVLQGAIDVAADGDTVLVAPGTYSGAGNRGLDFNGVNIVMLSELGAGSTTIDCESADRAFNFHSGESAASLVSGFTIANGHADFGGGVRCATDSSPRIEHCVFLSNVATSNGGGLMCYHSSPSISDCAFEGNSAQWGGGAFFETPDPASISDCRFRENEAEVSGGGLYFWYSDTATAHGIVLVGNEAGWGGGIYCDGSSPTLSQCVIAGNTAITSGGGINCGQSSHPLIVQCTFSANGAAEGGAVRSYYSSPQLENTVLAFSPQGGAISCVSGNPTIDHCCVFGNAGGDSLCGSVLDNIYVDPLLCGFASEDWYLCANSPCLPENNAWGQQIGAFSAGCSYCTATSVPEEEQSLSWGRLKAMYR